MPNPFRPPYAKRRVSHHVRLETGTVTLGSRCIDASERWTRSTQTELVRMFLANISFFLLPLRTLPSLPSLVATWHTHANSTLYKLQTRAIDSIQTHSASCVKKVTSRSIVFKVPVVAVIVMGSLRSRRLTPSVARLPSLCSRNVTTNRSIVLGCGFMISTVMVLFPGRRRRTTTLG